MGVRQLRVGVRPDVSENLAPDVVGFWVGVGVFVLFGVVTKGFWASYAGIAIGAGTGALVGLCVFVFLDKRKRKALKDPRQGNP